VGPSDITSTEPIPETEFINPGQLLIIPRVLSETTSPKHLMPDSEVVYSPSATSFDIEEFVTGAGGYLSTFSEWHLSTGVKTGSEVVARVAIENSINPRLLLALLEYQSNWVFGQPDSPEAKEYPMGLENPRERGLYNQLVWAVNQLSIGYYAYREGRMIEITFPDGTSARMAPDLNAGSAALQYFFAQYHHGQEWMDALDSQSGFPAFYERLYGDPWKRAETVEPLYPRGIKQPPLILPFVKDWTWAYTGGPHGAWERDGAYAGLDFAPGNTRPGCVESGTWTVAAADGLVVRSGNGVVVLDLDGDGYEQTGWVLVYLHVSSDDRIPLGSWVATGQQLGHASCEGGLATGTHIHLARKYNGEWVPADGPLPFNLGGWIAHAGAAAYKGTLTRDGITITANTNSNAASFITRGEDDP
jgi:murein DD-endopeptidase MepM/ murein hydrolase activator NlpD